MSSIAKKVEEPTTCQKDITSIRCLSKADAGDFRMRFDKQPFEFQHSLLTNHPLFQMERLKELAIYLRARDAHVHYDMGDIQVGQRWDQVPTRKLTLEETFDHVENAGAWIFLRQIEKHPDYAALLSQCMEELSELTGRDIREENKLMESILFITSPNRITSYHIDRECSILLQIRGDKQISVFDREDRDVLPEQEIETFWCADNNAPIYREQLQDRAHVFNLRPGNGVHIPVNCPHWLKNGNNISISLNMNYQFKDTRRKYIYQSNYYLRKMGLNPVPPGRSPLRDFTKNLTMGSMVNLKSLVRQGFKRKPNVPTPY